MVALTETKFIISNPREFAATRQKSLEKSQARSHAARAGHKARQKELSRQGKIWLLNPDEAQQQIDILVLKPFKGNSDPFNTSSPSLTPEYSYVLSFAIDVAFPSIYQSSFARRLSGIPTSPTPSQTLVSKQPLISSTAAEKYWKTITTNLADPCTFYACLTAYASIMEKTTTTPWLGNISISARLQALSLLRRKLENTTNVEDNISSLMLTLDSLFKAECVEGNVVGARAHAAILKHFFEAGYGDTSLLVRILLHDVDLAIKNGHETFLDAAWCAMKLRNFEDLALKILQHDSLNDAEIHPSIKYPPLRYLWHRNRSTLKTMLNSHHYSRLWSQAGTSELAFNYFSAIGLVDQAQMNNLYHSLLSNTSTEVVSYMEEIERLTQAALIIAMQYLWHFACGEWIVNDYDLRDASDILMLRLQGLMININAMSSTSAFDGECESRSYAEAHLWLVYIGAMHESRTSSRTSNQFSSYSGRSEPSNSTTSTTNSTFFHKQLWQHASCAGVQTWTEMQSIAESFFYADFLGPDGSTWFEDVVMEGLMDDYGSKMQCSGASAEQRGTDGELKISLDYDI